MIRVSTTAPMIVMLLSYTHRGPTIEEDRSIIAAYVGLRNQQRNNKVMGSVSVSHKVMGS